MKTLDEAIKHCEEKAKELKEKAESNIIEITKDGEIRVYDGKEYDDCLECAEEHEQLAEWLMELKKLREENVNQFLNSKDIILALIEENKALREQRPQGDLISREALKDAFDNLCCHNCKMCRNFRNEDSFYKCALIDNAPTVEIPENEVNCVLTMFGKCSYNKTGCSDCEIKDKIRKALNERPQGGWIPVSERLPDESDWYLVTRYDSRGYRITDMTSYNISSKEFSRDVIAWQPLPEPYQKGGVTNDSQDK